MTLQFIHQILTRYIQALTSLQVKQVIIVALTTGCYVILELQVRQIDHNFPQNLQFSQKLEPESVWALTAQLPGIMLIRAMANSLVLLPRSYPMKAVQLAEIYDVSYIGRLGVVSYVTRCQLRHKQHWTRWVGKKKKNSIFRCFEWK